ncbi:MAG: DUF4143 domain-containing protein [Elusimicrobiota bacterium]
MLEEHLAQPPGLILLGPRQVGKTTLLESILKAKKPWLITLSDYSVFQSYLKDSGLFRRQAQSKLDALKPSQSLSVFIDEIQKLPQLLDDCQSLYDHNKKRFKLIATGSSARKLKRAQANLLPGRVIVKNLHPLLWQEMGIAVPDPDLSPFALVVAHARMTRPKEENFLFWGSLPGILSGPPQTRAPLLQSYALTYLKEEIQAEALVRSLDGFSRFIELAALESGNTTNYQKLAKDVGLRLNTVKNYYSILVDTLIAIPLEPYLRNARKRLIATPKLYFFDIGVRNAAASMPFEEGLVKLDGGRLFEHWVILELFRRFDYFKPDYKMYFWRTAAGAEVDLVVDTKNGLIPIEIKFADSTANIKLTNLVSFMDEYNCPKGYVVGNFRQPEKLGKSIQAIPWWLF